MSSVSLSWEHLHRHSLPAFNGAALQRNLPLSIGRLKCLLLLLILGSVVYLCESVSSWCSHSCATAMDTQLLYSDLCVCLPHTFLHLLKTLCRAENARHCPYLMPIHCASCTAAPSVLTKTWKRSGLMSCDLLHRREVPISSKLSTGLLTSSVCSLL